MDIPAARMLNPDYKGSIVSLSGFNAEPIQVNTYDEYGIPGAGNLGRFQYTGQAWLPEVGLYYYKARMYSPTLGRFMQTDPIGYAGGGPNMYAYVANDPVNQRDPSGKCPTCQEEEIAFDQSLQGKSADEMRAAIMDRAQSQGTALATVGSLFIAPEAILLKGAGWAARALGIERLASRTINFASTALRDSHFAKHSAEFGFKSASAYERAAGNFMGGKAGRGVLEGTRKSGDVVRFNPKTNEFGVLSKDGNVRTYLKPDPAQHGLKDNMEYFRRALQ